MNILSQFWVFWGVLYAVIKCHKCSVIGGDKGVGVCVQWGSFRSETDGPGRTRLFAVSGLATAPRSLTTVASPSFPPRAVAMAVSLLGFVKSGEKKKRKKRSSLPAIPPALSRSLSLSLHSVCPAAVGLVNTVQPSHPTPVVSRLDSTLHYPTNHLLPPQAVLRSGAIESICWLLSRRPQPTELVVPALRAIGNATATVTDIEIDQILRYGCLQAFRGLLSSTDTGEWAML